MISDHMDTIMRLDLSMNKWWPSVALAKGFISKACLVTCVTSKMTLLVGRSVVYTGSVVALGYGCASIANAFWPIHVERTMAKIGRAIEGPTFWAIGGLGMLLVVPKYFHKANHGIPGMRSQCIKSFYRLANTSLGVGYAATGFGWLGVAIYNMAKKRKRAN
jgi:hypothetical protein